MQAFTPFRISFFSGIEPDYKVVHLWRAYYADIFKHLDSLKTMLNKGEQDRALKFSSEKGRRQYSAGRVFVRSVLAQHTRIDPGQLLFSYSKTGKPFLLSCRNEQGLTYNLSHSKDMLLLAVTFRREIGLDLEYIRPVSYIEKIARCYFSEEEQRELLSTPLEKRDSLFMKTWTRKEAYLKMRGSSIATRLSKNNGKFDLVLPNLLFIKTFKPDNNYTASLALEGCSTPIFRSWHWDYAS